MTKRSRRTHSAAFKAKVALAAIKGEKTLAAPTIQIDDLAGGLTPASLQDANRVTAASP